MTAVSISRLHYPIQALGPGRRVGVWLQGCSIRCPGCVSVDTWPAGWGRTEMAAVLAVLETWAYAADGLTVTGGEPFDQEDALRELLRGWRDMSGTDVLVFTGHVLDRVSPWLARNPGLIDALVTGPYDRDAPQTLALRGSDNQRLHVLTSLGTRLATYERLATAQDRRLDVMFDADGSVWLVGIPAAGDLARFRRAMHEAGHRVVLSDQTARADR